MQLLQITVTPMKYEMEIEPARLEYDQDFTPSADVKTAPAKLDIQTKQAKMHLDSYQARKSLGFANVADRIRDNAEQGKTSITKYTRESVEFGTEMGKIEDGVTIGQIINQKMLEQPVMYTAFLPSSGADISWEPHEIKLDYQEGKVNFDWKVKQNAMSYVPGSVHMRITQYARVDIEYVGSPIYIPRSADPNYEESSDS